MHRHIDKSTAGQHLGVVQQIINRVDGRPPDVLRAENVGPFFARTHGRQRVDRQHQRFGIAPPVTRCFKALVIHQRRAVQCFYDAGPVPLGFRAHQPEPFAVAGAIRIHQRVLRLAARRRGGNSSQADARGNVHADAVDAGAQQRGRYQLAFTAALAVKQCAHDAGHQGDGGDVVAQPARQHRRRSPWRGGPFGQSAAARKSRHVIARRIAVRTFQAVGRQAGIHQPRMFSHQGCVVQPNTFEKLRPHVGDEHIGRGHQTLHQRRSLGLVHVQRNAFLATVVQIERRAALFLRPRQGAK